MSARKKIARVIFIFEDGSESETSDLPSAVKLLEQRIEDAAIASMRLGPAAERLFRSQLEMIQFDQKVREIINAEQRAVNATKPRKATTKALSVHALEQHRDKFEREQGTLRGWRKAAAKHFGVSTDTIDKRRKA